MSNLGQGYWEMPASGRHSHKGQRGKRQKNLSHHTCFDFIQFFPLSVAGNLYASNKFKWDIRWPV